MTATEYTNVKLPKNVIERIDKLVGKYGFDSRADVVKDALRDMFKNYAETTPFADQVP